MANGESENLAGKILLASGRLMDPNFVRTIVLVIRHDEDGAFGLILNKPLDISVGEACAAATSVVCAVESKVYQGGPCDGPLMVLHTHEDQSEMEVVPGVYYTVEKEQIEWLMENNEEAIRFFAGYSGWGPGQLEDEIESGSWVTAPATKELIFDELQQGAQWSKLMSVLLGRLDPSRMPEDPSVN